MLDHAREACDLIAGRSREEVAADRVLTLALLRLLEVVGEAATRVPPEARNQHPTIPWPQIVALRNRLIHGYDAINFEIVWQILTADLPPLIDALESHLS